MSDDIESIPHNQYLTWVDTLKASFQPMVDRDPNTGAIIYPRKTYLTNVAFQKKQQADEAAKQAKQSQSGE